VAAFLILSDTLALLYTICFWPLLLSTLFTNNASRINVAHAFCLWPFFIAIHFAIAEGQLLPNGDRAIRHERHTWHWPASLPHKDEV
jgi:hypothetical protein